MQNHYNLIYREEEREMLPLCREEGIGVIPVESARARVPRRDAEARPPATATLREQTDAYGHGLYYADADYDVADRVVEVAARAACRPRRSRSPGCCASRG